jgi:hypothetical protein
MKHIPTTATAIRKIKTLAKRLRDEQAIPLAHALDAAAREAGYEHFHHATTCATRTQSQAPQKPGVLGQLRFHVEEGPLVWPDDDKGGEEEPVSVAEGRFIVRGDRSALDAVTSALDEFMDELDPESDDLAQMPPAALMQLIVRCQELAMEEPAFLDGYAHWAGALVKLDRGAECIAIMRPVYSAACSLVPKSFRGLVPYWPLENRPFHRLAVNLFLAYRQVGQHDEANGISQRMLQWWPNDNIGFRFLLNDQP